ncbi:MAG: dihydrodipicolinate synthase family protein [Planctomycetota bacterium]
MTRFRGSWVALATPFRGGRPDLADWRAALARQRAAGTDGVVVAGTTGEGSTLTPSERGALYAEAERSGLPWIASVGTSDTRTTLELAEHARIAGAHGLLVSTPAYARPSQAGLAAHFGAVAAATPLPVVLYDVPARTAVTLEVDTALAVARAHANVVAIKEAGGSLARLAALGPELDVLWGDDATLDEALAAGVGGAVSVLGNLFPALLRKRIVGDERELAAHFAPWNALLYRASNPTPLKAVLGRLGHAAEELRLPLVPVEDELRRALVALIADAANVFELEHRAVNANEEPANELLVE